MVVNDLGYTADTSGEHREQVFSLVAPDGETVLQRVVEVARAPTFTPEGNYVAFWRLTDDTIYCYDVLEAADAGRFDTDELRTSDDVGRAVNIGVEGVEYQGEPAFELSDTYGGNEEILGYITPTGDLIESVA